VFARHHYLSHTHNNAARVFLAYIDQQLVGFISVQHLPNRSPNIKKVHRLVVLPDYQGLGIGMRILNEVGKIYLQQGWRYTITTSSPSLVMALKKSVQWRCHKHGRGGGNKGRPDFIKTEARNRMITSFEMTWKP
jgi:GNAT superfamily N-acetyltransferase